MRIARFALSVASVLLSSFVCAAPVDHASFTALQGDFKSGPQVTKACLTCHKDSSSQLHKTQHWTWEYVNDRGQKLGKRHVINNFCVSSTTNLAACASCHIGYGMKDAASFDFDAQENVDCLVCHDTTGRYKKPAGLAGNPVTQDMELPTGSGKIVKALDLGSIARKVGPTSRATCGTCHFYGGGGDGVKHGDMDSSLEAPDRMLDVHMDAKGLNFSCTTCHETQNHAVPGSRYGPMGTSLKCENCHSGEPHKTQAVLNKHIAKVACQTCHIGRFARGGVPTKTLWDWSTVGQRGPDGKPLTKKNAQGYEVYNPGKGTFELAENVMPEYVWFNGGIQYTVPTDKLSPENGPIWINRFEGSPTDGKSKIWPVKVFHGKQAWDPVNRTLITLHLAGNDDAALWKNFDWKKAATAGMAAVKQPFSGEVAFIETYSMWPITHMVAPKDQALKCTDCHSPKGRLAKVEGISISGNSKKVSLK
jgi:octaheme c-type cytochrome (tetrathionate reductase family)